MKRKITTTLSILLVLVFLFSFYGSAEADSFFYEVETLSAVDYQVGDSVEDGIIVDDSEEYCGCCHEHQHNLDNFGERLQCFFCKIKMFFVNIFGGEKNVEHKYKIISQTQSTCSNHGELVLKCAVCSKTYTKTYEKLPHTIVHLPEIPATCTESGLTAGQVCSVCGTTIQEQQIIPATGHTIVIDEAVEPTCTTSGLTQGSHCSVCDEIIVEQQVIPATGHTIVIDEAVEPTCTTSGLTQGSHCSVCNEVFIEQVEIPATGHNIVIDEAIEPTCTTPGLTQGSHCSVCNEIIEPQIEIEPLGHSVDWQDDGNGNHIGVCSVCSTQLSHVASYTEIQTEYTGQPDGHATYQCVHCDITYTVPYIAKIGSDVFETLEEALVAAESGDTVYLLGDYTLTQNAQVKNGVTLLLPCMDDDEGYTSEDYNPNGDTTSNHTKLEVLYRTFTIPEDITLTVNGTMLINAVTGRLVAGSYTTYDITGGYALVNLEGNIVVNNDAVFDCSGRVEGDGQVTLKSGATMNETYSIVRWRGGSYAKLNAFDYKNVYPIYENEMNTMRAILKIESGASLYGTVKTYTSSYLGGIIPAQYNYHRFAQIDNEEGMYRLAEGAYCTRTVEWDDSLNTKIGTTTTSGGYRDVYKFYGGMTFTYSKMRISTGPLTANLYTDECNYFIVDGDMRFELYDGTYNFVRSFEFLPGFEMYAGNTAVINVTGSGGLLFADNGFYDGDSQFTSVGRYPANRADAYLQLSDGANLNVESGTDIAGKVIYTPNSVISIDSLANTSVTTKVPDSTTSYVEYIATYNPILQ